VLRQCNTRRAIKKAPETNPAPDGKPAMPAKTPRYLRMKSADTGTENAARHSRYEKHENATVQYQKP